MSRDVSLDIRLRPLDTKRFVGDFVRKFSAWIPEGSPVRTTRDVLRCALADLDWLDRDFKYSRKTRCWTAHGDQVINARQEDDYKAADGALVEWKREMKGINSIKAVLPAVLNSSAFIRERYSKPVYGSEIPSQNIVPKEAIPLIWYNDDGTVANPYKKLPPIGSYFPEGTGKLVEAQERLLEDVKNGGAELAAYGLLQFSEGFASKALEKALLRYCELDTMAVVFIWEYFNDMCKKRDRSESDV